MIIHLYSRCWNEERMIPYFLRHYTPLVNRIEIADDTSTDRSIELLGESPLVQIEPFESDCHSRVRAAIRHNDHIWKKSRGEADWVIICDIDEHMYHPDLRGYLQRCGELGVTAIQAQGFEMISDEFPETEVRLCDVIRRGAPSGFMEKMQIFNPNAIEETDYQPGRHKAAPVGQVVFPNTCEVKLLHYKYLGWPWLRERNNALAARVPPADRDQGLSIHYLIDEKQKHRQFKIVRALADTVI